ncbi:MAG: prolipoprotein diacylglyceryl transferase [Dehalococcoidia bacterium]|nr:prolipoprotein diacylglyceryl transferase [Dehalococcoidia bacterium]
MRDIIEMPLGPIAFRVGPLAIAWYGIMVVLAMVAVVLFSAREAKRHGIPREHIYGLAIWAIGAGIVGARLVHVIDYWSYYLQHPLEVFGFEGFAVWGAIIGATVATLLYAWRHRISFWKLGDTIAPGAVLAQAIGRLGCTLNGCCYGVPTDAPWAFMWTNPGSYAPVGIPVHPAQVYLLLWNLAVFGLLMWLRGRIHQPGAIFLTYVIAYALGDFAIRFVREGELSVAGLLQAQVIGLVVMVTAIIIMSMRMYRSRASRTLHTTTPGSGQHPAN